MIYAKPLSILISGLALLLTSSGLHGDPPASPPPPTKTAEKTAAPQNETAPPKDPLEQFVEEILRLRDEVVNLRQQLAEAQLQAATTARELEELRQFINDHHEYGNDFQQYKSVKAIAEREARERAIEAARQRREAEKQERRERFLAAREKRDQDLAVRSRSVRYQNAGFSPLGLNVFTSRMAFYYKTKDTTPIQVDYDPFIGYFFRSDEDRNREIDFSTMTISGSVLNGADEVRNIGIAVTFFDENGNQVGGEIVQINNARPDVPYPFTSNVDMALNRAFSSSSAYVLYADPVEADGGQ